MKEQQNNNAVVPVYNKEYLVLQANELIRAEQDDLTILEAKLLRFAIMQVMQDDADFKTFRIEIPKLAGLLKIPKNHIYTAMADVSKSLASKTITIKRERENKGKPDYTVFQWVSVIDYTDGVITIKLHDKLKPYLIGLNELFTSYQYTELLELPTYYSIRLFELLTSYQNMKYRDYAAAGKTIPRAENEIVFAVKQLRKYFKCEDKYKSQGNFISKVIDRSVEAINKNTILRVKYRTLTEERGKITHIVFKINSFIDRECIEERKEEESAKL